MGEDESEDADVPDDLNIDEYLSGMTYEEMRGEDRYPQRDDERRYQM